MKQTSVGRTLIAAILTLAASAAYGQENGTTAKIPFAFRAVGSDLPAGQYWIGPVNGDPGTMRFRNLDTGMSLFIRSKAIATESKDNRARLIFQCGRENGCSLARLWSGASDGLEFPTPKLTANQGERLVAVYLDRFKEK